jgi:hypothetical protein
MSKRYRFSVTLAADANATEDEAHRCLRAFLKMALRSYGLVCTSALPLPPSTLEAVNDVAPQRTPGASDDN